MAKFTARQIKKLKKLALNEKISIDGISGFGVPFRTKGIITVYNSGEPAVEDNHIFVDFVNSHEKNPKQSDIFGIFLNEIDDSVDFIKEALYIKTITDYNGNTIYENKDIGSISKRIMIETAKENDKNRSEGRLIEANDELDQITKILKLSLYVGKPIAVDAGPTSGYHYGIFVGCDSYSNNGSPRIMLLNGFEVSNAYSEPGAKLYYIDSSGSEDKFKLVASNNVFKTTVNKIKTACRIEDRKNTSQTQPGNN